jgi:hypothetical protein
MNYPLLEQLPRIHREAIESAGYRVVRWARAREVLQTRVTKGRIPGALGEFLAHWLPAAPATADDLRLTFDVMPEQIWLTGGGAALVRSPLEHALLHLPALRSFWSSELRQQHYVALKAMAPSAWLMDAAILPPGAVIHGLGIIAWDQLKPLPEQDWDMQDQILTRRMSGGAKIHARYERNEHGQVVLSSVEAMS